MFILNKRFLFRNSLLLRALVVILKPFSTSDKIYFIKAKLEKLLGFVKVIEYGDTVVQAGVSFNPSLVSDNHYERLGNLWYIIQRVGKKGTIVVIEPDPKNIKRIKDIIRKNKIEGNFIIIDQALYSKKDIVNLCLGVRSGWNRLDCMPESNSWQKSKSSFTDKEITVEANTLDNLISEHNIDIDKIAYVNLTINGAEYEALKGMKSLLERSKNLSITVIAGREQEGYGENDIGYIDGEPDHVVISRFLSSHGFKTKLKRLHKNKFGYVIGTKGNKPEYM